MRHVVAVDGDAIDGAVPFDELLAADPLPVAGVAPDHLAALLFTSGTAGAPRAAMLTHGNLLANLEQARSTASRIVADDVVYGVLPLYHIFGLNVVLGASLAAGASVVLVQRFDPLTALESIRDRRVTVIPGAPRCGSPSPTSRRPRPTPSPACASPSPAPPSCRWRWPSGCATASGSTSPRATGSPRPRPSSRRRSA